MSSRKDSRPPAAPCLLVHFSVSVSVVLGLGTTVGHHKKKMASTLLFTLYSHPWAFTPLFTFFSGFACGLGAVNGIHQLRLKHSSKYRNVLENDEHLLPAGCFIVMALMGGAMSSFYCWLISEKYFSWLDVDDVLKLVPFSVIIAVFMAIGMYHQQDLLIKNNNNNKKKKKKKKKR